MIEHQLTPIAFWKVFTSITILMLTGIIGLLCMIVVRLTIWYEEWKKQNVKS